MRVFISSTFRDLAQVRSRLIQAVRQAGEAISGMEEFAARPELPLSVCLDELHQSDVVILIVGRRYGSIDPDSGLSFTHREFREAMDCSIPVLALLLPEPDAAEGIEKEEAKRLSAFRREVLETVQVDLAEDPIDLPARAVAALHRFVQERANRIGQFRTFQDGKDYFAAFLDPNALFNHAQALVGRESILADLEQFIEGSQFVAVLPGAGGSGKSKLLLELARRRGGKEPRLSFLGPEFALSERHLRELPSGPVCITVDDAHRRDDLEALVQVVLGAAAQRSLKLLLTCRPHAIPLVEYALRSIREDSRTMLDPLPDLQRDTEALLLARDSLGADHAHLADRLVGAADGNAMIITVGGRLVQRGDIGPDLLAHHEQFRTAALEGLLSDLPKQLADRVPSRKLLETLAAVCPVRLGREDAESRLAEFLGVSKSAVVRAISDLDKHHLILRRGNQVRLKPDVLSDHLLFRAAVMNGQATGFVDEVLSAFSPAYLANILANAAELQWRCRVTGTGVDVLRGFFADITQDLPKMTHGQRYALLEALERPAVWLPTQCWETVTWMVSNPDAPADAGLLSNAYSHELVLTKVPPILSRVAMHEEFAGRCAALLWELAKEDARDPHPHPEHPRRMLQELIGYKERRPFRLQLRALEGLKEAVARERERGREPCVADIVQAALKREGEWMRSEGAGFSIGAIPLYEYLRNDNVQALRTRALDMLKDQALCAGAPTAMAAVSVTEELLSLPHGEFGRSVTQDERDAWLPEGQVAVDMLVDVANACTHDAVLVRIRLLLEEHVARDWWPELSPHLRAALCRLPVPVDLDVYLALLPMWDVHGHALEHEEIVKRDSKLQASVVKGLRATLGSAEAIIGHVGRCAEKLSSAGWGPQPHRLLRELAASDADAARDVSRAVIGCDSPVLQQSIVIPMVQWLQADPDGAFAAMHAALDKKQEALILGIANGYWHDWFHCSDRYVERHFEVLERLLDSPLKEVRRLALESLRRAPSSHAHRAVAMIIGADYADDGGLLDAALSVFDRQHGLDPALLTAAQISTLLEKLVPVQELSRGAYHIDEFLAFACKPAPSAVVQCLLSRVARSASEGSPEGYRPLPYTGFSTELSGLATCPDYPHLLRQIRDALLEPEWQYDFWIPKLYALASNGFCQAAMAILNEWVESGDPKRVIAAAGLLEDAGQEFVFDRHEFVAHLLSCAAQHGSDCTNRVKSRLHGLALSGVFEGSVGEPPPRFVEQQDKARSLAEQYSGRPEVTAFYREARETAERQIKESLAEDEEWLE